MLGQHIDSWRTRYSISLNFACNLLISIVEITRNHICGSKQNATASCCRNYSVVNMTNHGRCCEANFTLSAAHDIEADLVFIALGHIIYMKSSFVEFGLKANFC